MSMHHFFFFEYSKSSNRVGKNHRGGVRMGRNQRCCRKGGGTWGIILISLGIGVFLARLLPYYFLIFLFGAALVYLGIRHLLKK